MGRGGETLSDVDSDRDTVVDRNSPPVAGRRKNTLGVSMNSCHKNQLDPPTC
jgi:hypothetical protein